MSIAGFVLSSDAGLLEGFLKDGRAQQFTGRSTLKPGPPGPFFCVHNHTYFPKQPRTPTAFSEICRRAPRAPSRQPPRHPLSSNQDPVFTSYSLPRCLLATLPCASSTWRVEFTCAGISPSARHAKTAPPALRAGGPAQPPLPSQDRSGPFISPAARCRRGGVRRTLQWENQTILILSGISLGPNFIPVCRG